ncbi:MAG: cytidine deaminase [Elusimicrobiota bacterium]
MSKSFDEIRLVRAAQAAAKKAYAPYSCFHVGAAVLSDSGKIYLGANIENASYGLTVCAERVAIFRAVIEGASKIKAIAIVTPDAIEKSPCGACLQVISEFAAPETKIYLANPSGNRALSRAFAEFLPHPFHFPFKKR